MWESISDRLRAMLQNHLHKPIVSQLQNDVAQDRNITLSMLRLDLIHPVISGNKIFKLIPFLDEAIKRGMPIKTYGGAWSNHLAATAYACRIAQIPCTGMVRGEEPATLSETLQFCKSQGMNLIFLSRTEYRQIASSENSSPDNSAIVIPEGGFSVAGKAGASAILDWVNVDDYTHICVAAGTVTTAAGIASRVRKNTEVILFPALKGMSDIPQRFSILKQSLPEKFSVQDQYHFGGFGKHTPELIRFMNDFYQSHHIPLDFVYTAKMMYGVQAMLVKKEIPAGARVLIIHTGGLQGNRSIKDLLLQEY